MSFIQTFSGHNFYPFKPELATIDIRDIAHALSLLCRFNGQCKEFYSIAQHSVLLARQLSEHMKWGLLHDAAEAYLSDIPTPIKVLPQFDFYRELEASIMEKIAARFDLDPVKPPSVKHADRRMLVTEIRDLMVPGACWDKYYLKHEPYDFTIAPWPPKMAEQIFLKTADYLGIR